jgi:hypothetical protein
VIPTSQQHSTCPLCGKRTVSEYANHKSREIVKQCMGMCSFNERRPASLKDLKTFAEMESQLNQGMATR